MFLIVTLPLVASVLSTLRAPLIAPLFSTETLPIPVELAVKESGPPLPELMIEAFPFPDEAPIPAAIENAPELLIEAFPPELPAEAEKLMFWKLPELVIVALPLLAEPEETPTPID